MNLAEWAKLSNDQRQRVVVEWHRNWRDLDWDLIDLVEKAARSLEKELEGIPGVTSVQPGNDGIIERLHGGMSVMMPALCVCTSLQGTERLENLPPMFFGFRVKQENFGDKRDEFLATLKRCLEKLKGWEEKQATEWIQHWGDKLSPESDLLMDALNGGFLSSAVYSHSPINYAIQAILDEDTRMKVEAIGNDSIKLRNELLSVIYEPARTVGSTDFNHPDRIENFDWKSVKKNLERIIENYSREKQPN